MGYILGEPTVQQYFDANGDPLENGTIEFFIYNTSTPTPIYSNSTGTSAGTSVTLNSIGAPKNGGTSIALFFDESVVYKIVRKDSAGSAIAPTIGPYYPNGGSAITIDAVASTATDSLYDYTGASNGDQASVAGYYVPGDGGGGMFYWNSTSTAADDGGVTILPTGHVGAGRWKRIYEDYAIIEAFGAKGDGVTDDSAAFTASAVHGFIVLRGGTDYHITSNVSLPDGCRVRASGSTTAILSGIGTLAIQGTISATVSNLTASNVRGDNQVAVVDGSLFSADDFIQIIASADEDNNNTKLPPAEMNEVLSVSVNTITTKYPLVHRYNIGGTPAANVTILSTVATGISIEDIDFTSTSPILEIADNIRYTNCTFSNGTGIAASDSVKRNITMDVSLFNDIGAGSGVFALYLYNIRSFTVRVLTHGSNKDGVRLWGCADGVLEADIYDTVERGVWLYRAVNVRMPALTIKGSLPSSTNLEALLFDYSTNCIATDVTIDEPNKSTGVAPPQQAEFRGDTQDCHIRGGEIAVYSNFVIVVKMESTNCSVSRVVFNIYTATAINLCDMNGENAPTHTTSFRFDDNRISNRAGSEGSVTLFRTATDSAIGTSTFDVISISRNIMDRGKGSLCNIGGDGTGFGFGLVVLEGNQMLEGNISSGSIAVISGMPVERFFCKENYLQEGDEAVGNTRQIISSSANEVVIDNCNGFNLTISNETYYIINGLGHEEAAANTPSAGIWRQPGTLVDFVDTVDASGTGVWLRKHDQTWTQIS